MEPSLGLRKRA